MQRVLLDAPSGPGHSACFKCQWLAIFPRRHYSSRGSVYSPPRPSLQAPTQRSPLPPRFGPGNPFLLAYLPPPTSKRWQGLAVSSPQGALCWGRSVVSFGRPEEDHTLELLHQRPYRWRRGASVAGSPGSTIQRWGPATLVGVPREQGEGPASECQDPRGGVPRTPLPAL